MIREHHCFMTFALHFVFKSCMSANGHSVEFCAVLALEWRVRTTPLRNLDELIIWTFSRDAFSNHSKVHLYFWLSVKKSSFCAVMSCCSTFTRKAYPVIFPYTSLDTKLYSCRVTVYVSGSIKALIHLLYTSIHL